MVNKVSCIKELLLCLSALKLNLLRRNSHCLKVLSWICYLFPHLPALIHHQRWFPYSLSHNRTWRCHRLPGQLIAPLSQVVNVRQYLAAACCSAVSFQLEACSMPPGLEGAPASVPAKIFPCAEPPPAHAPEPGAAGIEVPQFSANWPLWPNGWGLHAAPDVCNKNNHQSKNRLTLFDLRTVAQIQRWFALVL